VMYY